MLHQFSHSWKVKRKSESVSHSVKSGSLWPRDPMEPSRLLCPCNSLGKNTGVGSHSLLQGIFPIQGSNPGLLHCSQIFCHLSHQLNHSYHNPQPLATLFFIISIWHNVNPTILFLFNWEAKQCWKKTAQREDKSKIEPSVLVFTEAPRLPNTITFQSKLFGPPTHDLWRRWVKTILWVLSLTYLELWILPDTPSLPTP